MLCILPYFAEGALPYASQYRWATFFVSPPIPAKAVDFRTAKKWIEAWKNAYPQGKEIIPALGYDPELMKLLPYDMPADDLKYRYDPNFLGYVSQAWFRDSVIYSTNDLGERIRKLENTVNRIMAECCPQAK